jgi:alpha-tubulin suppressor-like RCC1 family protein
LRFFANNQVENELFSFGSNERWQLGRETLTKGSNSVPGKIDIDFIPVQVACFKYGSACLSSKYFNTHIDHVQDEGKVYVWGVPYDDPTGFAVKKIKLMEGVSNVTQVATAEKAAICLTGKN